MAKARGRTRAANFHATNIASCLNRAETVIKGNERFDPIGELMERIKKLRQLHKYGSKKLAAAEQLLLDVQGALAKLTNT